MKRYSDAVIVRMKTPVFILGRKQHLSQYEYKSLHIGFDMNQWPRAGVWSVRGSETMYVSK